MAARVQIVIDGKDNSGGVMRQVGAGFGNLAKQAQLSFTEINNAMSLAMQGLRALKQGYDFAKEGAQLDFVTIKFDRMAQSIGTTGDVLLDKMMVATRGTLSEMEAMASATDLLSLGLVKTEKDAVRLATVVAGLGMDMNQLVLALSNQTTMRFDQLGIAVVGFDEKVKALEATGMSASDAFGEAFLQQAEEQLVKVGHAADTTLGSFMRFEAQLKDLKDESKMLAAEGLAPIVSALAENMKQHREFTSTLKMLNPELAMQYEMLQTVTPEMKKIVDDYIRAKDTGDSWQRSLEYQNVTLGENATALELTKEQIKAISDKNQQFISVLGNVGTALETYRGGVAASRAELDAGKITAEEHAAKVAELGATYEKESAKIVQSIVAMKFATDGWTDAELTAYLNISQGLGLMTMQQVNAAKQALATADQLVAEAEPLLHVGNLAEKAGQQMGVFESAQAALAEGISSGALPAVGGLKSQLQGMPPSGSSWSYDFFIRTHGRVPPVPSVLQNAQPGTGTGQAAEWHAQQGGQQQGGEVFAGVPTWVGEAGRERFVPAMNGRILGHAESLHAASLGGGGGGGTNYFYGPVTLQISEDSGAGLMSLR